jgi:hypothetical protein
LRLWCCSISADDEDHQWPSRAIKGNQGQSGAIKGDRTCSISACSWICSGERINPAASSGATPVRRGISVRTVVFSTVPKIARPNDPPSDRKNITVAVAGAPLYPHVRETLVTSLIALGIALAFFFLLGEPGDFDSSHKMAAIAAAFRVTPWLFLPLVIVIVMALYKFPPFTTILTGAFAGGIMAAGSP